MALTLRRPRLEKQPVFADLQDCQVLEDGNEIGRIYEQHAPTFPGPSLALVDHHPARYAGKSIDERQGGHARRS
jgi:hypothetical protein